MDVTERRYVMTKVGSGDYLLPSNDGLTIWRIARDEGEGWSLWRWSGETRPGVPIGDPYDWSKWELREQGHDSRRNAVDAAMRAA